MLREDPRLALGEHRRVNVEATRGLAEAAGKAGVGTMVFVSSIGAVTTRSEVPLSESAPCWPTTPYGFSKLEAERALQEVASETGLRVVVVRPPLVYGPGAPGNFGLLHRAVERGWPLPLALVRNRRSFVYVGNLVDALIRCLEPAATGATFHVADREVVSTPDFVRRLAAARGRRARLFPVPPRALRLVGAALGRGDAVARLLDSLVVDAGLIARVLDWSPPYTLDDGLARTVAKA